MTWYKHRHVMCRVASFCCSNDLQKESSVSISRSFSSLAYLTILMTQCGRAAKVYVVIGMECAAKRLLTAAKKIWFNYVYIRSVLQEI